MGLDWIAVIRMRQEDREDYILQHCAKDLASDKSLVSLVKKLAPVWEKPCRIVGARQMKDLPDFRIRAYDHLAERKEQAFNSVQHHMRCISTILSTAVEWQMIVANPCERVKPPKIVRKKIKFLEIEEAKSLIEAATKLDDMRVKTAVLLFLYSGIRKGELAGLQWNSDVDLENSVITVNRTLQYIDKIGLVIGPPKTEEGEREITISSNLVDYLKSYKIWQIQERLKVGDQWQKGDREKWLSEGTEHDPHDPKDWQPVDWMFTNWRGYPLHPSTIYHWIKDFLKENNHPLMTVHGLRHTNISLMLAEGVDLITASKRAGHAKPSTTADIYAHALKKPDRAAAEKLNTLLSSHKKKSG